MEKLLTKTQTIERRGVFDKTLKKRFELTFECKDSKEKKSILVIGLNPASDTIEVLDTTTAYILNHFLSMGYSTITIWNLYADIFKKLKPSTVKDNEENLVYLQEILKRNYDTILLGYGNTFLHNKLVNAEKEKLCTLLKNERGKVKDLVDEERKYERIRTLHPLMAGRYFPNKWVLRDYPLEDERKEVKKK